MGSPQWREPCSQRQKEWTHAGMKNRDTTEVSYILYIPSLFAFFLITQHLQTFTSPSCFPCLFALPHCMGGVGCSHSTKPLGCLFQKSSSSLHFPPLLPYPFPAPDSHTPGNYQCTLILTILGTSYKWNQTVFVCTYSKGNPS